MGAVRAVDDLDGEAAAVRQREAAEALGAALAGGAGERAHDFGVDEAGSFDELRVRAHGGADLRQQLGKQGEGGRGHRHRRRVADDAAAVDTGRHRARVQARERRERPERRLLCRVVRLLVAGDVPAVMHAGGEEPGVVARAVVPRPERGVAAQVLLAEAEVRQHAAHEVRLEVQALVRGAHDREFLGAPAEVLDGAVGQPRLRLERLGGRPPVGHHAWVAPALDDLAVRSRERGAGAVQALDGPAAAGLDEDLGVLDDLGHGAAPQDDCGESIAGVPAAHRQSTPLRGSIR